MKLTSTANEVGFDAQRNRLRFFATSYSYSKHFIYAFNGRTRYVRTKREYAILRMPEIREDEPWHKRLV